MCWLYIGAVLHHVILYTVHDIAKSCGPPNKQTNKQTNKQKTITNKHNNTTVVKYGELFFNINEDYQEQCYSTMYKMKCKPKAMPIIIYG